MRWLKNASLVLFSAAVIGVAFFLPGLISQAQDQATAGMVEIHETSQVTVDIAPTHEVSDTLRIIASGYTLVDLDSGMNMDSGGVITAALEVLSFLGDRGFSDIMFDSYGEHSEKSFMAVSETGSQAAIVWECTLASAENPDATFTFIVDDASGKVVSFSCTIPYSESEATAQDRISLWAEAWAEYFESSFREYQGIPAKTTTDNSSSNSEEGEEVAPESVSMGIVLSEHNVILLLQYEVVNDRLYTNGENTAEEGSQETTGDETAETPETTEGDEAESEQPAQNTVTELSLLMTPYS